jgi:type I restriction enzyme, S subunit
LQDKHIQTQLHVSANGVTRYGLSQQSIKDVLLPIPPLDEQLSIVASISNELPILEVSVSRAEREIALIREYRTRLIADVVTGQLDVREAAGRLPDEPNEEDVELVEEANGEEGESDEFEDIVSSGTIG